MTTKYLYTPQPQPLPERERSNAKQADQWSPKQHQNQSPSVSAAAAEQLGATEASGPVLSRVLTPGGAPGGLSGRPDFFNFPDTVTTAERPPRHAWTAKRSYDYHHGATQTPLLGMSPPVARLRLHAARVQAVHQEWDAVSWLRREGAPEA